MDFATIHSMLTQEQGFPFGVPWKKSSDLFHGQSTNLELDAVAQLPLKVFGTISGSLD